MINCSELLRDYSDYRDGLLPPSGVEAMEAHLAACPACARYHEVIHWGVAKLRTFPPVEPSADFLPRLQHRIYQLEEQAGRWDRGDSSAVSLNFVLVVIFLFGAIAWLPILRPGDHPVHLPPIAAGAPASEARAPSVVRQEPQLLPADFSYVRAASNAFYFRPAALGSYADYRTPASSR